MLCCCCCLGYAVDSSGLGSLCVRGRREDGVDVGIMVESEVGSAPGLVDCGLLGVALLLQRAFDRSAVAYLFSSLLPRYLLLAVSFYQRLHAQ